ncbi:hypothetical protein DFH29DRAFT_1000509 [Suillus ampliporus]|nr:hypothetical protein DFH29DRAFT_1000509 [Suillus ampliporus]
MVIERKQSFASPLLQFARAPVGKKKLYDIGTSPSQHGLKSRDKTNGRARARHRKKKRVQCSELVEAAEGSYLSYFTIGALFFPSHSDDASHDEALSSHIAVLNPLNLGLEHLDVGLDAGSAGSEI